jgi:phage shock protein A
MLNLVVCVLCVLGVLSLTNKKVRRRLKSLFSKGSERVSDALGDVRDDREEAIKERSSKNSELEGQLVKIRAQIILSTQNQQNAVRDAEKYGLVARRALESGNEEVAKSAIGQKQKAEDTAKKLLETIQSLESKFENLKVLLLQSKDEVENAKSSTELFKTEYVAVKLQQEMLETENSFGGLGKLDFGDSESELARLKAEIQAKQELSGSPVLKSFEKSESEQRVLDELRSMKV